MTTNNVLLIIHISFLICIIVAAIFLYINFSKNRKKRLKVVEEQRKRQEELARQLDDEITKILNSPLQFTSFMYVNNDDVDENNAKNVERQYKPIEGQTNVYDLEHIRRNNSGGRKNTINTEE